MSLPPPERILCAAIWVNDGVSRMHLPRNLTTGLVFAGWRHHNCFTQIEALFGPEEENRPTPEQRAGFHQGFLTSRGRFVDREEGAQIAYDASQVDRKLTWLSSEDLY